MHAIGDKGNFEFSETDLGYLCCIKRIKIQLKFSTQTFHSQIVTSKEGPILCRNSFHTVFPSKVNGLQHFEANTVYVGACQ